VTVMQFQLFDELPGDEYDSLKADIAKRGVLVPIEYDEDGNLLDGHHRKRIVDELGIKDYPTVVRRFASEAEKEEHVVTLNVRRRHLNGEQKRRWVAWFLERHPERSNRQIASDVGVDDKTVGSVRREMEAGAEIPHLSQRTGKDGKAQPASKPKPQPSIFSTSRQTERAQKALATVGEHAPARSLAVRDIERLARKEEKRERAQQLTEQATQAAQLIGLHTDPARPQAGQWWQLGRHRLYCGDSTDQAFIDDAKGATFAFADPPYNAGKAEWDQGFTWQHDYLTEVAEIVAVTPGISAVQDFFTATAMPYRWSMAAWITNGMTRGALGFGNWIYLALFSYGESLHRNAQDVLRITIDAASTSETNHASRKPVRLLVDLLDLFTEEGDTVVDPFLGSGTTLFAADQTGRTCVGAELDLLHCGEIIAKYGPEAKPL